jgi:abortive infection bacteriophage resistance protein
VAEYTKPWLSIGDQLDKLESRGVYVSDRQAGARLLSAVGYYRVTGYLYPLRESEPYVDANGRKRARIHNNYRAGTTLEYAEALISFDRQLRMLILDGIERIEISLRTQLGHVLGRQSAFAHLDPTNFVNAFTDPVIDPENGEASPSKHEQWIERVEERRADSDETFVAHFREKYDNAMPIWALTEILEMGQLGRLYGGLNSSIATEIATTYDVPTKKMMSSWISSLNYVRNVSAHHARLFNRKLVTAPSRPSHTQIPLLGHLKDQESAKQTFGVYNAFAIMAYLIGKIEADSGWPACVTDLIDSFPVSTHLTMESMGVPEAWSMLKLWSPPFQA